jgi:hypothetical protein
VHERKRRGIAVAEQYYRLLVDQRILPVLYSSMEAAVEHAGFLRTKGREAVVVDPEGRQTWPDAPLAERRLNGARASSDVQPSAPADRIVIR